MDSSYCPNLVMVSVLRTLGLHVTFFMLLMGGGVNVKCVSYVKARFVGVLFSGSNNPCKEVGG